MLSIAKTSQKESNEILRRGKNFVIVGFGDLGKGRHQLLTDQGHNVFICSLNGRQYNNDQYIKEHYISISNIYALPISFDAIDAVLICITTTDLRKLPEYLPKGLKDKIINRLVFFQNGIGTREQIKNILHIGHPTQAIPYFSFKTMGGSHVDIAIAKPSPIAGNNKTIHTLIDAINTGPHQDPIFEGVDSIILNKEERKKGYVNSFLNSICVIYKSPVAEAVQKFLQEYGPFSQMQIYKELTDFNNNIFGNEMAHMELQEIQEDIETAISKFATKYPSTYFQYYNKPEEADNIHSDEQTYIGRMMAMCRHAGKELPLITSLYERMIAIKKKLEQNQKK